MRDTSTYLMVVRDKDLRDFGSVIHQHTVAAFGLGEPCSGACHVEHASLEGVLVDVLDRSKDERESILGQEVSALRVDTHCRHLEGVVCRGRVHENAGHDPRIGNEDVDMGHLESDKQRYIYTVQPWGASARELPVGES
jgi:hypothetical protein